MHQQELDKYVLTLLSLTPDSEEESKSAFHNHTYQSKLNQQVRAKTPDSLGHVFIHGLEITIENRKGTNREGKSKDGKPWSRYMNAHYGYIRRMPKGADSEHVDVYVGPNPESELVFIIDQVKEDGKFDEIKVVIGTKYLEEAKKLYLSHYPKNWTGLGEITPVTMTHFKELLKEGKLNKAYKYKENVKEANNKLPDLSFLISGYQTKSATDSYSNNSAYKLPTGSGYTSKSILSPPNKQSVGVTPQSVLPTTTQPQANIGQQVGPPLPMTDTTLQKAPVNLANQGQQVGLGTTKFGHIENHIKDAVSKWNKNDNQTLSSLLFS